LPLLLHATPTSTKHHPHPNTLLQNISAISASSRLTISGDKPNSRLPHPRISNPRSNASSTIRSRIAHRRPRLLVLHNLDPDHPSPPTYIADRGYRPTTSAAAPASSRRQPLRSVSLAFEDIHRSQRSGNAIPGCREGARVRTRHPIHQLRLRHADAKRHPARDPLRHADNIRLQPSAQLPTLPSVPRPDCTSSAIAESVPIADTADLPQEVVRRNDIATLARIGSRMIAATSSGGSIVLNSCPRCTARKPAEAPLPAHAQPHDTHTDTGHASPRHKRSEPPLCCGFDAVRDNAPIVRPWNAPKKLMMFCRPV